MNTRIQPYTRCPGNVTSRNRTSEHRNTTIYASLVESLPGSRVSLLYAAREIHDLLLSSGSLFNPYLLHWPVLHLFQSPTGCPILTFIFYLLVSIYFPIGTYSSEISKKYHSNFNKKLKLFKKLQGAIQQREKLHEKITHIL